MKHLFFILAALFLLHTAISAHAATIQLPRTGQTTVYAAGDDGDLREGIAWPDPRFIDNNNGTVTDRLTGLIWLKNTDCFAAQPWASAIASANGLASGACGLTDGSTAGQWRLPNIVEMESLVDAEQFSPALPAGHPFPASLDRERFWSSTTENFGSLGDIIASITDVSNGRFASAGKSLSFNVWPVRDGQTAGTILLPRTGQTTSYAPGDDGALEKGVAWPAPRFTDNGDGAVTDNLTGLTWLKNANCFGPQIWATALGSANSLASGACGLGDGSVAGDWRLPNRRELRSLIDISVDQLPIIPLLPAGHPFSDVQIDLRYWSSTTDPLSVSVGFPGAFGVFMSTGGILSVDKTESHFSWPVRNGQYVNLGTVTIWTSKSLAFGNRNIGDPALTRQVTLKNKGAASQAISGIAITGTNPADFAVAPGGATPCPSLTPTLAPGASCTVLVSFAPLTVGSKTAALTVSAGASSVGLPLSGAGAGVSISGTVKNGTGAGVSGVTFTGATCTATDISGQYTCTVAPGSSVTVTPVSPLFTFTPAFRSYTAVTVDQTGQDYTANAGLTVTRAGTGTGTVTPSTGVLSFVGNVGTATYPVGISVTLSPLPDSISTFGGWTGPCTLAGTDCTVSMTVNRSVTATFTAAPKAKIGTTGFTSLNAAYTAAAQGATIRALDTVLAENLLMNLGKNVSIQGGYNALFSSRTGNTTLLQGLLTVGTGSLTADGLGVK